jgi:hypothetical protein
MTDAEQRNYLASVEDNLRALVGRTPPDTDRSYHAVCALNAISALKECHAPGREPREPKGPRTTPRDGVFAYWESPECKGYIKGIMESFARRAPRRGRRKKSTYEVTNDRNTGGA